jgi:hypothetical protein
VVGTRLEAIAAVIADAVDRHVVDDGAVVDVSYAGVTEVVDRAVVVHPAIAPVAAVVTTAAVSIPVVHAAIKAHMRAPISLMPEERSAGEAPIARRPQIIGLRRFHPGTWDPVVVLDVVAPGPITGRPNITVIRHRRLLIDGKFGRRNVDRDLHGDLRHAQGGKQQPKYRG